MPDDNRPPQGVARKAPLPAGDLYAAFAVTWTRPDGRVKTSVFSERAGLDRLLAEHHLTLED